MADIDSLIADYESCAVDIINHLLDEDKIDVNALRAATRRIKHCGDYGKLYVQRETGKVHWTAADSDGPENGYTDTKEIKKILKLPGVTDVEIGDEWSPDEDEGWERLDLFENKDDEDGWIGVDFDGTLAKHTSYKGSTKFGDVVPKMAARVRRWVGRGKKVKIFTARADDEKAVNAIKKWLKDNELPDLEITNLKDHKMVELWDDKAIAVEKNTGEVKEAFEDWWEPNPQMVEWFQRLLSVLEPVARWGVPDTGQIYLIDQPNMTVTLIDGDPNDELDYHEKNKKVFQNLGFTVYDSPQPPPESEEFTVTEAIVDYLINESPEIKTLKKNAKPLDPEERAQVMKAGAVWHHGPNGEATPAVRKATVNGKTWYWCATHRYGQVRPTLKGAIKTFDRVEATS